MLNSWGILLFAPRFGWKVLDGQPGWGYNEVKKSPESGGYAYENYSVGGNSLFERVALEAAMKRR
jgi:hypothetical protein